MFLQGFAWILYSQQSQYTCHGLKGVLTNESYSTKVKLEESYNFSCCTVEHLVL